MSVITITIDADDFKTKCIANFIKNHFKQFSIAVENNCGDDNVNLGAAILNMSMSNSKIVINKTKKEIPIFRSKNTSTVEVPPPPKKKEFRMPSVKDLKDINKVLKMPATKEVINKASISNVKKSLFEAAVEKISYKPPVLINPKEEVFVPIPGYTTEYVISNFGNIKSITRTTSNGATVRARHIKIADNGYVSLTNTRKTANYNVSRLVYGTFKGVIPNEMRFVDNDKTNRRLSNLIPVF